MSKKCDLTGRKTSFGHAKKHARGSSGGGGAWRFKAPKTNRTWLPNLRKVRLTNPEGKVETLTVSMKAYKKLRAEGSFKGYTLKAYNEK